MGEKMSQMNLLINSYVIARNFQGQLIGGYVIAIFPSTVTINIENTSIKQSIPKHKILVVENN